ncbi:hypothetical protein Vadar_003623 [Vaccinium darrowii]|uniref:Uncharacterized protein n=1 Tax=Vaccinium darrowii TaxID=229202 RepID=A0ACB7YK19_9ERIC|nr:hypothetical protein Vadar_003623 [Vaccinium darrowii]
MDFWGVEVKSGEPCLVEPGQGRTLHLSQACLGEVKKDKGNESVYLYVTVEGKKFVLGTLSSEKFPQLQFDLLFDDKFELSHSWKNGIFYSPFDFGVDVIGVHSFCSVFLDRLPLFIITIDGDSEDESEEDLPANVADDGKPESQAMVDKPPVTQNASTARPDSAASKQNVKTVEPNKVVKTVEEDDSSEDDFGTDTSDDVADSDEDEDGDSESGEGDTEDDDEEEETPRKVELSKKRPVSATETQGADKKAKFVTPQKTETKKSGSRVDTPYPSKQAGKTLAIQSKQQTPKPAGSHPCKSCNRSFNSENALDSHTKAKHTPGKRGKARNGDGAVQNQATDGPDSAQQPPRNVKGHGL